jgi:hypothetical protein
MPYIVSSSEVSFHDPNGAQCLEAEAGLQVRSEFVSTTPLSFFLPGSLFNRELASLCTSEKYLRGSTRPVTPNYLARQKGFESNRIVVLLIVRAVYQSYRPAAVRLEDRFHTHGVRL